MSKSLALQGIVAVIDSGVGGLSVLAELRQILPHNSFLYYADSSNCPYGSKSHSEILKLTLAVVQKVVDLGASIVVVACNTMTAVAIDDLRREWKDVRFVGMEPAVKPALHGSRSGVVGVLATRATLGGRLYNSTKEKHRQEKRVVEVAGDGLVEYVEVLVREGKRDLRGKELLRGYLAEMIEQGVDKIVLGCTHYPFLIEDIEEIFEQWGVSGVEIINPAPAVAMRTKEVALDMGLVASTGEGSVVFDY